MSSVEYLREFVNERLTAAAEEIFRVFNKTIFEYEEEIDRQRKLLDVVWKPDIKLNRIELPQQHVCKEEEVLADQQLCIQERNSSLDQEDPEPPQIKEEQEELCTSQEGEQLEVKQETETFMLTHTDEESDHSEDQTLNFNPDQSQSVAETELPASMCISWIKDESDWENPEVSEPNSVSYLNHDLNQNLGDKSIITSVKNSAEPNSDHQLLSHNSHVNESQDQKGGKNGDSTRNAEPKPKKRHHKCTSTMIEFNTHTNKKSFKCHTCEKVFNNNSNWRRHLRIHTDEKPFTCKTCEKSFKCSGNLIKHMRIHTGEKSYPCKTCEKYFRSSSNLMDHMRTHTGEKPYLCKTCGNYFRSNGNLMDHMRRAHTGERPYLCKTCGKDFCRNSDLLVHIRRAHTGEKPYLCKICWERFFDASQLKKHVRSHTGK
ncbi:zinc finger and SCAN domain-containing protein 2-like isoform X1 [Sebastes umbrosus]|uniref:zinc finger and SCAN domain-containing protein 2-like isoform X1 n=1 Tax=Sebastes umbrosus TaxID=72105 RepID=UPI0018A06C8D|nr:zinc finger and SCAN domain-containing protein 2-like isoform X1 [Sebastes umbrosus]